MTLDEMRRFGIRTVNRVCERCGSHGIVQVDALPGEITVVALGRMMECVTCGAPETETQPNWPEGDVSPVAQVA